ncbi:hypothetical protein DYB28_010713 [Aphanomyces astaci]|uniref:Uncharacterized protein n=1 Tax=Aphanomyces astaci TaxID=112090 RepID=A0A9X8DYJ6_APHAT|nr:hypothetical protein DYB28_010713 [Aphanomyces astaci]
MGQVVPNRVVGLANLTLAPSSLTKAVQRQADLVLRKSATRGNVRELLPGQTVVLDTYRRLSAEAHAGSIGLANLLTLVGGFHVMPVGEAPADEADPGRPSGAPLVNIPLIW